MELLTNAGATVEVPLEAMGAELGKGGVIGHLSNKIATIKLAPASRNAPVRMTFQPPVTLGAPSLTNIMTGKQKAPAKINALAP
jgi:hypothetical protein